jgi:peptidoglycan/LPS O-acetylase OafA/YrhL
MSRRRAGALAKRKTSKLPIGQRLILLDYMRAISIIGVLGFHFFPKVVPMGYLGVDVFFLISGYLITRQIDTRFDIEGKNSLILVFYKNRFLRLFPATVLPIVFLYFFFLIFGSHDYFVEICKQILFSMFGLANYYFFENTGYFQLNARSLPLLHFWSLSIEIQFYTIFPIAFIAFKLRHKVGQGIILFCLFLALVIGVSSSLDFTTSYFSSYIRFSEILLGTIAYYTTKNRKPEFLNLKSKFLLTLPFVLITCIFVSRINGKMKSLFSIILVLTVFFTILLLNKCHFSGRGTTHKLLILIGKSSYSIYIYHWIILVTVGYITPKSTNFLFSFFLLVSSLCIGFLSYKFIELSALKNRNVKVFKTYICIFALMVLLSALGLNGSIGASKVIDSSETYRSNMRLASSINATPCDFLSKDKEVSKFCNVWNESGKAGSILVWGDSFSNSWIDVFRKIAKTNDIRIVQISHAGCPPLINVRREGPHYGSKYCSTGELQDEVVSSLGNQDFKGIFLIARWNLYITGLFKNDSLVEYAPIVPKSIKFDSNATPSALNTFRTSWTDTVNSLSRFGPVTTILQTPTMPIDISLVKEQEGVGIDAAMYLSQVGEVNQIIRNLASVNHSFIDPRDIACKASFCPGFDGMINLYSDDAHPSSFLVFKFENEIRSRIRTS